VEGQCVVYVLTRSSPIASEWKLLEFRLNDESGELVDSVVMDGPADTDFHPFGRQKMCTRKSPFLYIPTAPGLVFDTRTRLFYEFPEYRVALDETPEYNGHVTYRTIAQIALTNTYIICLNHYRPSGSNHHTVVQVFTLPPDGSSVKNGNRVLCLTHEGVVKVFHPSNVEVLNPLVDPVTGATRLSLLDYTASPGKFQVTRVDLTLPEPRANGVSPMVVEMQHYKFPNEGQPTSGYETCSQYVDVSEEGEVRGFYRGILPRRPSEEYENDHIMKFTIDTRQDEWVVDCGELVPAEWSHLGVTRLNENIMFDGMRGKICFGDPEYDRSMFVVDIE